MSRRNRYRRPNDTNNQQKEPAAPAQVAHDQAERPSGTVVTLHLGGRNPFKHHNAYLIPGSRHVLVDPGPPGSAGELLEQLSRHRVSLGDIGLIVITHGHPDHFGSAAQFKEWTQALLAVHELDAEYVSFGTVPMIKPVSKLGTLFKSRIAVKPPAVEPDIMLHDGDRLGRYAGKGTVIQTPGHTAGSISILLPDGTCIIGDLLMRGVRSSTPSLPWFAEDISEVRDSLQKVVSAGARTLLAAHGGPFHVEDLARRFTWLEVPEGRPRRDESADADSAAEPPQQEGPEPNGQKPASEGAEGAGSERPRRRRPRRRRPRGQQNGTSAGGQSSESQDR